MSKRERLIQSTLLCAALTAALVFLLLLTGRHGQAAASAYTIQVKEGPLILRSAASSSSKNLGSVAKEKTLTAASRTKAGGIYWYKVRNNDQTGYLCGKYLSLKKADVNYAAKYFKKGTTKDALSVRSKASTSSTRITTLAKGTKITIRGWYQKSGSQKWYRISYGGKIRYLAAAYVTLASSASSSGDHSSSNDASSSSNGSASDNSASTQSDSASFESYLKAQGFPASYHAYLRKLHKAHPQWVFKAQKTGLKWSTAVKKETSIGTNLVHTSYPDKYKKKISFITYNPITGKYKGFDGADWVQASDGLIKYYLDPRNFLNESSIYQFLTHTYQRAGQNTATIRSITSMNSSCFMDNTTYANWLMEAGRTAKVNPNVITAMIIQEQGWRGTSSLISGRYKGYLGYYNYFNIGAYHSGFMNAVQRGLWYAKGSGIGDTSYGRPWNKRYLSIKGGALFYKTVYLNNRQYTYYTKKFNVLNGSSQVGEHQYMSNIMGADSEAKLLKCAYRKSSSYAMTFYIPVYTAMPAKACAKP